MQRYRSPARRNLAARSAWNRRFVLALVVGAIALSTLLLLGIERIRQDLRANFSQAVSGTDLIVGPRTGSVQLLLYAVFRIGNATNNIRYTSAEAVAQMRGVAWVVPLSLGDSYQGILRWSLSHKLTTLAAALAIFVTSIFMVPLLGTEFVPKADFSETTISFYTPVGSALEVTEAKAKQVEAVIREFPEVRYTLSTINTGNAQGKIYASIYIRLVDRKDRQLSVDAMSVKLRERLREVPGITVTHVGLLDAVGGNKPLQLSIQGSDLAELQRQSAAIADKLRGIGDQEWDACDLTLDLEHPGTKGWLLHMLREATGTQDACASWLGGEWRLYGWIGASALGRFPTEGAALAAALLAVWNGGAS